MDRARAQAFASDQLGKLVVRAPDRAGFLVNSMLIPYLLSALLLRMVAAGLLGRKSGRGFFEYD